MTSPDWIHYAMEEQEDPFDNPEPEPDYLFCYLPTLPPLLEPVYSPGSMFHYPRYRLEAPLALCRTRTGSLYFLPVIEEVEEVETVELVSHVRIEELPSQGVTQNHEQLQQQQQRYVVEEPAEEETAPENKQAEKLDASSSCAEHSAAISELKPETDTEMPQKAKKIN